MWSPLPESTLPRVALGELTFQGPKGGVPGAPKFLLWSREPRSFWCLEPWIFDHSEAWSPKWNVIEPWSPDIFVLEPWSTTYILDRSPGALTPFGALTFHSFFLSLGGKTTQGTSCLPSAGRVTLVGRRTIYHANTLFRSPSRSNSWPAPHRVKLGF